MRKTKGLRALFTMVGSVIGAGFVSGRELLQFFGYFRISTVYYTGLLFFFSFLLCVRLRRSLERDIRTLFKNRKGSNSFWFVCFLCGNAFGLEFTFAAGKAVFISHVSRLCLLCVRKGSRGDRDGQSHRHACRPRVCRRPYIFFWDAVPLGASRSLFREYFIRIFIHFDEYISFHARTLRSRRRIERPCGLALLFDLRSDYCSRHRTYSFGGLFG